MPTPEMNGMPCTTGISPKVRSTFCRCADKIDAIHIGFDLINSALHQFDADVFASQSSLISSAAIVEVATAPPQATMILRFHRLLLLLSVSYEACSQFSGSRIVSRKSVARRSEGVVINASSAFGFCSSLKRRRRSFKLCRRVLNNQCDDQRNCNVTVIISLLKIHWFIRSNKINCR